LYPASSSAEPGASRNEEPKAPAPPGPNLVKTQTFVSDFDEFQKCADIRMRYLGVATPTSATVGVTRLAGPDFMIEIEGRRRCQFLRSGSGRSMPSFAAIWSAVRKPMPRISRARRYGFSETVAV
jgi:hypothetical protein